MIEEIIAGAAGKQLDLFNQWGTNLYNINQADVAWKRNLGASSTAYQRAMADMRAAGLNPILAAHNGGSQVSGASTAQAAAVQGGSAGDLLQAIHVGTERQRLQLEARDVETRARQASVAERDVANREAQGAFDRGEKWNTEKPNVLATRGEIEARTLHSLNSARKVEAETPGARAYSRLMDQLAGSAADFIAKVKEIANTKGMREGIGDWLYNEYHDPKWWIDRHTFDAAVEWIQAKLGMGPNSARSPPERPPGVGFRKSH